MKVTPLFLKMLVSAIEVAADLVGRPASHIRVTGMWVRIVVVLAVGLLVAGVAVVVEIVVFRDS